MALDILKQTKRCNDDMKDADPEEIKLFGEAFDIAIKAVEQQKKIRETFCTLEEIIARNVLAWETSKDKREGLLPEIYLTDRVLFKQLTGEEPTMKNIRKFANVD